MSRYSIKLISSLIIVTLGIFNILIFYVFTYRSTKKNIETRYYREAELMLTHTEKIIEQKFISAERALHRLANDPAVIHSTESGDREYLAKELHSYDDIILGNESIWIGLFDGTYINSRSIQMPEAYDPRETIWYKRVLSADSDAYWVEPFLDYLNQDIVFTVSKPVYSQDGELLGVVAVFFNVKALSSNISASKVGDGGYMMLLSNNGEVIANRDDYFIGRRIFGDAFHQRLNQEVHRVIELPIDTEPFLIDTKILHINGMVLATAIRKSDIRQELQAVFARIFMAEALVLAFLSFVIYVLTRRGIAPLVKLVNLMQRVEQGDYTASADFSEYKEIAVLSNGFNNMIRGINTRDEILRNREVKIQNLAYYDNLTGLPNRALLLKNLQEIFDEEDGKRHSGAIMYIDLDRFKIINDTMGHSVGDKVLLEVARKISHNLRHGQLAARLGGDEFVVLLPGVDSVELVMKVADRLMKILNLPVTIESKEHDTHASIGIVFYPLHGNDVEVLLKKADMAMYKAKREGKNNYQIFEENLESEILRKLNIKNGIREALEKSHFEVHYQPQYSIPGETICGMEALLRCSSPLLKGIPIHELIDVAEETGQIAEIENYVLGEACLFARRLMDTGHDWLRISINISPIHIIQRDLVASILSIIEGANVKKHMIELEITESIMLDFHESNLRKLEEFNEHGIRIHMDDFGTGYSSLNYLQELPIHYVKIDKSFVQRINTTGNKSKIIALIIELAHNLGLEVIAEGVENETQYEYLKRYGCDIVQGYYHSKPVPPDEVFALIATSPAEANTASRV